MRRMPERESPPRQAVGKTPRLVRAPASERGDQLNAVIVRVAR